MPVTDTNTTAPTAQRITAADGSYTDQQPPGTFVDTSSNPTDARWWKITPAVSGTGVFDLAPTTAAGPVPNTDTVLYVALGNDSDTTGGFFDVADDGSPTGAGRSRLVVEMAAGQTYYLRATMYAGGKSARLGITYTGPSTDLAVLGPVVDLTATGAATDVAATWSPPAAGPAPHGYRVVVDDQPPVDVGNVLEYATSGLTAGPHTVTVRAYTATEAVEGAPATYVASSSRTSQGTFAAHPGAAAGDVQLLAVATHATVPPDAYDGGWTKLTHQTTDHSRLTIYTRKLTAATAAAGFDIAWAAPGRAHLRTYRRALGLPTTWLHAAGLTSPSVEVPDAALLVRYTASAHNNNTGAPNETLTADPVLTHALSPAGFDWFEGLVSGDDPATGDTAPARTATTTAPSTSFPQTIAVLLAGAVTVPAVYTYGPEVAATSGATPIGPLDKRWWTHRLAHQLALDPVATQPVVELRRWYPEAGWTLDETLSRSLTGYRVSHGRKDATGRTPTTIATMTLITARAGLLPIGTRLQLALSPAVCTAMGLEPAEGIRWTGEVTDPAVDHDARLTTITGAGRLGRGSRLSIDADALPTATADTLLPLILAATRIGLAPGVVEPGGGPMRAPAGSVVVGGLLDSLVASTGGQLIEQPAGHIDWHSPDHRRGMPPRMTLSAGAVLRRVTWSQSVGDLVNVADVGWGDGNRITVEDTASSDPVRGYGPYGVGIDTLLTTESDAYDLGSLIVGRRAEPAWRLPDLTVIPDRMHAAGRLSTTELATLLTMRHAHRLAVAGLPSDCPVPPTVILEGWEETATPRTWQLTLSVSDPRLSGVAIRWVDIAPDVAWTDIHPAVRWLDMARMESSDELLTPPD